MANAFVSHGRHFITFADHFDSELIHLSSNQFKNVHLYPKGWHMYDLFEIFVRSLGEGAPEPKVRLTMTCLRAGHFFCPNP